MTDKETLKLALEALAGLKDVEKQVRELVAENKALKKALAHEQEPVAVHQFRSPHCSDWYDGVPDHHDGHGPYETRTLYTSPPQRTWIWLTAQKVAAIAEGVYGSTHHDDITFAMEIQAKLKEENT